MSAQREQERSLREVFTSEDEVTTSPKRRGICLTCLAGAGVVVAATMLGAGALI